MKMVRWINILGLIWIVGNSMSSSVRSTNKDLTQDYQKENFSIDHLNLTDVRDELINNFDFNDLKLEEFKIEITIEKLLSKELALLGRNKIFKRIQMLVKKQFFSNQENNDFFEFFSKAMGINREMWNSSYFFKKIFISHYFYLDKDHKKLASYEDIISGKIFYLKIIWKGHKKSKLVIPVHITGKEQNAICKPNEVVDLKNGSFTDLTLTFEKTRAKRMGPFNLEKENKFDIMFLIDHTSEKIFHDWSYQKCSIRPILTTNLDLFPMHFQHVIFLGDDEDLSYTRTTWGNTPYYSQNNLFGSASYLIFETKKVLNNHQFIEEHEWDRLKKIVVQPKEVQKSLAAWIEFSQEVALTYYYDSDQEQWKFQLIARQCCDHNIVSQGGALFMNIGKGIRLKDFNPKVKNFM